MARLRKSIRYHRRANLQDAVWKMGLLFVFGFVIIILGIIWYNFNDAINADPAMPIEAKNTSTNISSYFASAFDYAFGFAWVLLFIGSIIVSARFNADPKYVPLYIIAILVVVFFAQILSNTWQDFANNASIYSYSVRYPIMNWFFNNFAVVTLLDMIVVGIALYSNTSALGGGGM